MKNKNKTCNYPIRVPEGNRFQLAIYLSKVSWEGGWKLTTDWKPADGDVVSLFLVTPHGSIEVRNLTMDGNLLSFEDNGTLAAGTYDVDIRIVLGNGERYGCLLKGKLRIVQANDEAGISDTYEIDGAVVLYAKGDKGDPGNDGTVSFEDLSPEQIAMLKGDKGDTGVGIESVEQTTTSDESEGVNVVTITLNNDEQTQHTFEVRNGKQGDKGDDGKSAYQVYLDTVPQGEEPMSESDWLASLKGVQGDKGDDGDSAYKVYLDNVPEGETPMTEAQWLASLKGEKGDQGAMGDTVIIGNEQTYTLYSVKGNNTNGAMTQAAVTEALDGMFVPVTSEQVAEMADPS